MPLTLVSQIYELLYIIHNSMNDFGDPVPQLMDYWSAINVADLCQLEQEGTFASSSH
jgi:hypothetical protein